MTEVRYATADAGETELTRETHREALLDDALRDSFPASDPISANRFD
jgi:hypothetical protein